MLGFLFGAVAVLMVLALTVALVVWWRLLDVEDDPIWQALAEQEPPRRARR